mmetsp:Transcript_5778/g.10346  ORF Transcript_5778/g.10346 Transcript_5778/m.10346 type:complete len:565 (-) Transcript_5778:40-1734(-)
MWVFATRSETTVTKRRCLGWGAGHFHTALPAKLAKIKKLSWTGNAAKRIPDYGLEKEEAAWKQRDGARAARTCDFGNPPTQKPLVRTASLDMIFAPPVPELVVAANEPSQLIRVPSLAPNLEQSGWKRQQSLPQHHSSTEVIGGFLSSRTSLDMFMARLGGEPALASAAMAAETEADRAASAVRRSIGKPQRYGEDQFRSRRESAKERLALKQHSMAQEEALRCQVANSLRKIQRPQLRNRFNLDNSSSGFLGEGRQGAVRLAKDFKTGEKVAVKTCNKFKKFFKTEDIGSVRNEVAVLQRLLPHPNSLRFIASYESPINIHIVTEYCEGGDLFAFLNSQEFEPQEEADSRRVMAKLLDVINACHQQGVAHLDIKLENLMRRENGNEIDAGDIVLVDFGHARDLPLTIAPGCSSMTLLSARLRRPVGSPSYAAPEVVLEYNYNHRSDIWSLGVVAFVLLQGYLPYPHLQSKQWRDFSIADYDSPSNSPFRYEMDWKHLSPEALDFVQRALQVDPERRLSVEQAMSHPWIKMEPNLQRLTRTDGTGSAEKANSPDASLFSRFTNW